VSIRVIYSTEAFLHKNGDKSGTQSERYFTSLDEAKATAFPEGYTFASIPVENGRYVYHSAKFGWEFYEGNG
jgi:hypothetical protein